MATRKRPGAAKRTVARQEADRKRSAPGKRFVGETAEQSEKARRAERKKVARMTRAARKAKPAEAARTAGRKRTSRPGSRPKRAAVAAKPAPRAAVEAEAALRAAEEDAALHGAEVEPAGAEGPPPLIAEAANEPAVGLLPAATERGPGESRSFAEVRHEPPVDVSAERSAIGEEEPPPLGSAIADLARSALGLARTVIGIPFRIALAIPRVALRAVANL